MQRSPAVKTPRAERCAGAAVVEAFQWSGVDLSPAPRGAVALTLSADTIIDDTQAAPNPGPDFGALERDAFTKGYAQGERAGAEAAATRGEAMLRRLAITIDEIVVLRADMMHATERQMVELAVAIARRIMVRELTIDRTLLSAMARVALDRLGDSASATIRLHPEDHQAIATEMAANPATGAVRVVADPAIARGGCVVQSDFGLIDVGLDAQLTEVRVALIGDGTGGFEGLHHAA